MAAIKPKENKKLCVKLKLDELGYTKIVGLEHLTKTISFELWYG